VAVAVSPPVMEIVLVVGSHKPSERHLTLVNNARKQRQLVIVLSGASKAAGLVADIVLIPAMVRLNIYAAATRDRDVLYTPIKDQRIW